MIPIQQHRILSVNVQCAGDVRHRNINDVTDEADNCTVNPVVAWVSDVSDNGHMS